MDNQLIKTSKMSQNLLKYIEESEYLLKYYDDHPTSDSGALFYKEDEAECLILGGRNLTCILSLPTILTHLFIQNNNLTELCELPATLIYLKCSNNRLTCLPRLPEALLEIDCSDNRIMKLPKISASLQYLDLCHNELTEFPEIPENSQLININCSRNHIREILNLPCPLLTTLKCNDNQLTTLCELPTNISKLDCFNNILVTLPPLDKLTKLIYLNCSYNRLTHFSSNFPENLYTLNCRSNSLTELPPLKNIHDLDCVNNKLYYLPDVSGVIRFQWYYNPLYPYLYKMITTNFKKNINLLFRLRTLFYSIKCKKRLMKYLWERVRRRRAEALYHPDNLIVLLNNVDDESEEQFHNVLSAW
jgi:Leucine-rich repeat (LRR) protein